MVLLSELLQGIIAASIVALIVGLCCLFYWRKRRKEKQQRHAAIELNNIESHSGTSDEQKQHKGSRSQEDKWHKQERRRKLEQILQDHALRDGQATVLQLIKYKELDLHNYTVKEAMEAVELYLAVSLDDYKETDSVQNRYVDVITGRGKHSKDGIPVIKLAVSEYLVAQAYISIPACFLLRDSQLTACKF